MKIDEHRFWSKVDIGTDDDCWNWTAKKSRNGYGRFHQTVEIVRSD